MVEIIFLVLVSYNPSLFMMFQCINILGRYVYVYSTRNIVSLVATLDILVCKLDFGTFFANPLELLSIEDA